MATKVEESDFVIDKNNLGNEWLRQPILYLKYSQKAADAHRDVDECKNTLEITRAEMSIRMRKDPEKYDLVKVTETALSSAVDISEDVKNSQADLIEARHDYEVLQAAVGAMEHRKKALESYTSLFLAGYFGDPKAKQGESDAVDEMRKREIRRKGVRRD
jgi:anaerobic selenocysteine-containing dehydrogenase